MKKLSLDAVARGQLKVVTAGTSGRSAETVYGGHEHVLRQTVLDLIAIPAARHTLEALEDSAVLLTVAKGGMTMPEHTSEGHGGHPDLAHIHEALTAAYSEALADPRNQAEGLDGAACDPHIKHLAAIAAAAAAGGASAAQWRTDVLANAGPAAAGALDGTEACMRRAGLWPWNS